MENMRCFVCPTVGLFIVFINLAASLEILIPLRDAYVLFGKPFWWTCVGKGDDPSRNLIYHWRFEDIDIGSLNIGVTNMGNGTLYIDQVKEEHLGYYTCIASNGQSAVESRAFLRKAYVSQAISSKPSELTVQVGQNASFNCYVDAKPEASVEWTHNDEQIVQQDTIAVNQTVSGKFSLQIQEASYGRAGIYKCIVYHETLTQPIQSEVMELKVVGPPIIVSGLKAVTVPVGQNMSIPCRVKSTPQSNVVWTVQKNSSTTPLQPGITVTKNNSPVLIGQSILSINEDENSIYIVKASEKLSGQYTCEWSNEFGSAILNGSLLVGGIPQAPVFTTPPADVSLVEFSELRLHCTGTGNPSITISWLLPTGNTVTSENDSVDIDGTYSIEKLKRTDAGVYQCVIRNSEGLNTANATVEVLFKPYFVSLPEDLTVEEFSTVKIPCHAEGKPKPIISWNLPWFQEEITVSSMNSINDISFVDNSLVISKVGRRQHGEYTCMASNDVGVESVKVTLKVVRTPVVTKPITSVGVVEGDDVLLECHVDSYPPSSVEWYHKHTPDPSIQAVNVQELMGSMSSEDFNNTDTGFVKIESKGNSNNINFMSNSNMNKGESVFTLNITHVEERNAGIYLCRVENERGSTNTFGVVRVITYPYFDIVPEAKKVLPGDDVMLRCQSSGIPVPSQRWLFNDRKLDLNSRFVIHDNGSLFISDIDKKEIGSYKCLATNQAGQRSVAADVKLSAKPYLTTPPINKSISETHSGFFNCFGSSEIAFSVAWYNSDKNGKKIKFIGKTLIVNDDPNAVQDKAKESDQSQNIGMRVSNNGSLIFECVEKSHQIWYVCELENEDGVTKSEPVFLRVESLPSVTSLITTATTGAKEGDAIDMKCSVRGSVHSKLSWVSPQRTEISSKENKFFPKITVDDKVDSSDESVLLSVTKIAGFENARHGGEWWCKICSDVGCTVMKTSLVVEGKPAVQGIVVTRSDTQIKIKCLLIGRPVPEVSFLGNNVRITNKTVGHTLIYETLVVDVDKMESEYVCVATNIHGTDSQVFGVPSKATISQIPPGQNNLQVIFNLKLKNPHASLTGISVEYKWDKSNSWNSIDYSLKDNLTGYFDVFKDVRLENSTKTCEEAEKTTHEADGLSNNSEEFTMSVASTGDAFIYSFETEIKSLDSYTLYSVRIITANGFGRSVPSERVQSLTLPSAPSAVSNIKVSIMNMSCLLTWDISKKLNGKPQDIVIEIKLFYNSSPKTVQTKTHSVTEASEAVFQNLRVGPYTAKFTPSNTDITVWGETTVFNFDVQDQPPSSVPELVEIRSITSNSFTVIWKFPDDPTSIIPPVTGYLLLIKPTDIGTDVNIINVDGVNSLLFTVKNLLENQQYNVQIASKNEAGSSEYSPPMRVTTRFEAFSEKALGSADLSYSVSWKLIAVIIVSFSIALMFVVAFHVFHNQVKLYRSDSIDITPAESTEGSYNLEEQTALPDFEGITNSNFLLY